jgi:hypothetical protein
MESFIDICFPIFLIAWAILFGWMTWHMLGDLNIYKK